MASGWRRRVADKTVRLWSLGTSDGGAACAAGPCRGVWRGFSPDGQVLATTSADKTVRLWSLGDPTAEPRLLRGHAGGLWRGLQPDGQMLATTSADKTVRLWSLVIDDLVRRACLLTSGNFSYEDMAAISG